MPNYNEIRDRVNASGSTYDIFRRGYQHELSQHTERNVIIYYSAWLQRDLPHAGIFGIDNNDKNGFMAAIHGLDRDMGLDLILHTPGGDVAAIESLIEYLRQMFGTDIRAIIPQMAMSGGTMIACACKEILMGKQSSLGPVDPQVDGGLPAVGVLDEFDRAINDIKQNRDMIPVWQPILAKYPPALIGKCERAVRWSKEIVANSLSTGMYNGENADETIKEIIKSLTDNDETKSHNRQFSAQKCKDLKLKITMMEDDPKLQDLILSIHHAAILTFSNTAAIKIIENHVGKSHIIESKLSPNMQWRQPA